jgi:hypothetical protein
MANVAAGRAILNAYARASNIQKQTPVAGAVTERHGGFARAAA